MLVGALPGHRSDFSCGLDHATEPRQLKPTCLYSNAARFTEELFAVSYPNDKRIDTAQHCVDAIKVPDIGFRAFLLGDVLQRAEPSHSAIGVDEFLNWLDCLANLNPVAIGVAKAVFDIGARPRRARFKRFGTKRCAVPRMKNVQPLARTLRHPGSIDSDELRQRLRPAFE